MEKTVYMVSRNQNGYIDGDTYNVFVDYKRAVTEFKSLLGDIMLEGFNVNPSDGNLWDVLNHWYDMTMLSSFGDIAPKDIKIPLDSQEFKNEYGGCISVWLSDEDYLQLRAIEEVS